MMVDETGKKRHFSLPGPCSASLFFPTNAPDISLSEPLHFFHHFLVMKWIAIVLCKSCHSACLQNDMIPYRFQKTGGSSGTLQSNDN